MSEDTTRKAAKKSSKSTRTTGRISEVTGTHPVATGTGAVSGAVAGAAVGMAAGPVGAAIGGVVGAVAGGLAGKGIAELVNPVKEEEYWRESYVREPYFTPGKDYDYYAPAYRTGWEGRVRHDGKKFEDVEPHLREDYERMRTPSNAEWDHGRLAARAAWERIDDITVNSR